MVQCSRCLTPSGDESVPDHCCTPAQNRRGSLGSSVCGLWTSPVPAWTGFCTRRATSVAPSGLGICGHAATIPEVDVRRHSGPVAKELWWKTADRSKDHVEEIKQYFVADAWLQVQQLKTMVQSTCAKCHRDVPLQIPAKRGKQCVKWVEYSQWFLWYHLLCTGVKSAAKNETWYCHKSL